MREGICVCFLSRVWENHQGLEKPQLVPQFLVWPQNGVRNHLKTLQTGEQKVYKGLQGGGRIENGTVYDQWLENIAGLDRYQ